MTTTTDRVTAILIEQLGVTPAEITPGSTLSDDLSCDSLDRIELLMAAEEEFGIAIEDEDAERVTTVAEMVALIDAKLAEQVGAAR